MYSGSGLSFGLLCIQLEINFSHRSLSVLSIRHFVHILGLYCHELRVRLHETAMLTFRAGSGLHWFPDPESRVFHQTDHGGFSYQTHLVVCCRSTYNTWPHQVTCFSLTIPQFVSTQCFRSSIDFALWV